MVSKMKSSSVNASGALATALLSLSIVFVASPAPAEGLDAISCLPPTVIAENSAEVAEAFEVTCISSRADAQTFEVASPSAIEGQAIPIEITQSVTIAAPGDDIRLWGDDALDLKKALRQSLLARDLGTMPVPGAALGTAPSVAHPGGVHHVRAVAVKQTSKPPSREPLKKSGLRMWRNSAGWSPSDPNRRDCRPWLSCPGAASAPRKSMSSASGSNPWTILTAVTDEVRGIVERNRPHVVSKPRDE